MSNRDDSVLYTGLTSASYKRLQEKKEEKKQEKSEKRGQVLNVAEPVFAEITKEKELMGELLLALVNPDTPDEGVAQHLEAVRLHRAWLLAFEIRMKNVLRQPKDVK